MKIKSLRCVRRLLDGVAMPVPRCSTEKGRPHAPDTLVDFHTGGTELPLLAGYAPGTNATHHLAIQKKAKSNLAVAFGRTSSALLDSARRPRPDPEDGSNGSSRTTPTPRQLDP